MQIQQVDIIGLQLLQRVSHRQVYTTLVIARIIYCLALAKLVAAIWSGESAKPWKAPWSVNPDKIISSIMEAQGVSQNNNVLGGNHDHIAVFAFLHPISKPCLGLLVLVIVLGKAVGVSRRSSKIAGWRGSVNLQLYQ